MEDRQLVLEQVGALLDRREREARAGGARSSFQPAPTPTSIRPPLISSTVDRRPWRSTPGWRNVTGETSTPSPIRCGLAGQAGEDRPGVGGRLAGRAREAREVVRAEERIEAVGLGALGRRPAGRRSSSPAGARSSGRSASRLLHAAWTIHLDTMIHIDMIVHVTRTIDGSTRPRDRATASDDLTDRIIADFRATIGAMKCAMSERLVRLGISMAQLNIMYTLQRDGEMPMSRLADVLDVSLSNATGSRGPDGGARVRRTDPRPGGPSGRPRPHHGGRQPGHRRERHAHGRRDARRPRPVGPGPAHAIALAVGRFRSVLEATTRCRPRSASGLHVQSTIALDDRLSRRPARPRPDASDRPAKEGPPHSWKASRLTYGSTPSLAEDPALGLSHRAKMEILFAVMLGLFLGALDQTIVGPALPTIVTQLRATTTTSGPSPSTCSRARSASRSGASCPTSTAASRSSCSAS